MQGFEGLVFLLFLMSLSVLLLVVGLFFCGIADIIGIA